MIENVDILGAVIKAVGEQSPYVITIGVFIWDKIQRNKVEAEKDKNNCEIMQKFTETLQELKETVALLKERITIKVK